MTGQSVWISGIIVGLISAAASFGAGYIGTQVESRKLDIQMVDIALQLLRSDSKEASLASARQFAIEALKKYSGITTIPDAVWEDWKNNGTVPKFSLGSLAAFAVPAVEPGAGRSVFDSEHGFLPITGLSTTSRQSTSQPSLGVIKEPVDTQP